MLLPLAAVRTWGEMVKFSHSVFALPFAALAAFLAARAPPPPPGQLGFAATCTGAARRATNPPTRVPEGHAGRVNHTTRVPEAHAGRVNHTTRVPEGHAGMS